MIHVANCYRPRVNVSRLNSRPKATTADSILLKRNLKPHHGMPFFAVILFVLGIAPTQAVELRVATFKADVTPPIGSPLARRPTACASTVCTNMMRQAAISWPSESPQRRIFPDACFPSSSLARRFNAWPMRLPAR
jgi:hypothetical protein